MFKAKWLGVLAVTALVGGSVVSVAAANAKSVETIIDAESDGVMSYKNPLILCNNFIRHFLCPHNSTFAGFHNSFFISHFLHISLFLM